MIKFICQFLLQIFFVILVHHFYCTSKALDFLSNTGNIFVRAVKCSRKMHQIYSQWKKH